MSKSRIYRKPAKRAIQIARKRKQAAHKFWI
jgi:hypothetical protein